MNIKQPNIFKVVPPKKACEKYSAFFWYTTVISINTRKVNTDMNAKMVQKPGSSKSPLPLCCKTTGGIAISNVNSKKKAIMLPVFICDNLSAKISKYLMPGLTIT